MNKPPHTSTTCTATMKLLGDYWTLRIIHALGEEDARFCELQRRASNVNPVTLSAKLKKLERAQLVARQEESVDKLSVVYSLTSLGREVLPVIRALDQFALVAEGAASAMG